MKDKQNRLQIRIKSPVDSIITFLNVEESLLGKGIIEEVLMENIGPGGLRFLSNLNLSLQQETIYSFHSTGPGFNKIVELYGIIIWKDELFDGLYQYGVHFELDESERGSVTDILNEYSQKYFTPKITEYSLME